MIVKSLETLDHQFRLDCLPFELFVGTQVVYLNQKMAAGSTEFLDDTDPDVHVITLGHCLSI